MQESSSPKTVDTASASRVALEVTPELEEVVLELPELEEEKLLLEDEDVTAEVALLLEDEDATVEIELLLA